MILHSGTVLLSDSRKEKFVIQKRVTRDCHLNQILPFLVEHKLATRNNE